METASQRRMHPVVFQVVAVCAAIALLVGVLVWYNPIGRTIEAGVEVVEDVVEIAATGTGALVGAFVDTAAGIATMEFLDNVELPLRLTEVAEFEVQSVTTLGLAIRPRVVTATKKWTSWGFFGWNDESVTLRDVPLATIAVLPLDDFRVDYSAADSTIILSVGQPYTIGTYVAGPFDFDPKKGAMRRGASILPLVDDAEYGPVMTEFFGAISHLGDGDNALLAAAACSGQGTATELLLAAYEAVGIVVDVQFVSTLAGMRTPAEFNEFCGWVPLGEARNLSEDELAQVNQHVEGLDPSEVGVGFLEEVDDGLIELRTE